MTVSPLLRRSTVVFRRAVLLFYWLLLPFLLALLAAWAISAVLQPANLRNWLGLAVLGVFTALIAWRLWLNRRASGLTGPLPEPARLMRVFLPLGLLAVVGFVAVTLGLAWMAIGGLAARDAALAPSFGSAGGPFSLFQMGLGGLMTLIGLALCAPFWRRLTARASAIPVVSAEPAAAPD